ncbi:hypothetical protein D3C86_1277280 [compost metagenome]
MCNRDLREIEPDRLEVIVEEGVAHGLHVEVEDGEDGALGPRAQAGPQQEGALQVLAEQVLVERIRAEVPLEGQVDVVVEPTHAQAALEVGAAIVAARGGLLEDLAQIADLRPLQVGPQLLQGHPLLEGVRLEEGAGRRKGELVIVEFARDRLDHALGPAGERCQSLTLLVAEPEKCPPQGQVRIIDAIFFAQGHHDAPSTLQTRGYPEVNLVILVPCKNP